MALTYSKQLYLQLSKYGKMNLFPLLGNNFQNFMSVVHYSDNTAASSKKLSGAMEAYLKQAVKYDKFIKEQLEQYELGKKFLAGMMGRKSEEMTEKDVDDAIEYLFPSALYVPKSRPMMKPPSKLYEKQKEAFFDYSGRPFNFLFYTSKPNYSKCLHEAASILERLNMKKLGILTPTPLSLTGGKWCTKEELEKIFLEKLYDIEYDKFIELFERLSQHAFAQEAENFIKKYWRITQSSDALILPEVKEEDNVKIIHVKG